MAIQGSFLFILLAVLNLDACAKSDYLPNSFNRGSFPTNFLFGTASAAYLYEGAAKEGGRGPSIWDTFAEKHPEKIEDHSNGMIADDSYHRYKEDVNIMKDLGFDSYRLSISWSRLLPCGKISAGVNPEGVAYYNNLINELLSKGVQPFVTLFHWDLPQALEDEYGGFLSPKIVTDFCDYVELCYKEFSDRVKHGITINEPLSLSSMAYAEGKAAPRRCSEWMARNCTGGDSSTEPYIVAHNQLLAHAAAVKVYKDKYQASQKGQIGIAVSVPWMVPYDQSEKSYAAANRTLEFMYGWFMEPLKSGSYPTVMVEYVKQRLPEFTEEQSSIVKGSFDFIGVNYYSTNYVFDIPCKTEKLSYATDPCTNRSAVRNEIPIGPQAAPSWLYLYPERFHDLLLYTKEKYNNPVIYVTGNGIGEYDNTKSLQDNMRVDYYYSHLLALQRAIKDGVDVRGYFAWPLLDNFQWRDGYSVRFGIVQVDYTNGQKRYYKNSAKWFKNFLCNGN